MAMIFSSEHLLASKQIQLQQPSIVSHPLTASIVESDLTMSVLEPSLEIAAIRKQLQETTKLYRDASMQVQTLTKQITNTQATEELEMTKKSLEAATSLVERLQLEIKSLQTKLEVEIKERNDQITMMTEAMMTMQPKANEDGSVIAETTSVNVFESMFSKYELQVKERDDLIIQLRQSISKLVSDQAERESEYNKLLAERQQQDVSMMVFNSTVKEEMKDIGGEVDFNVIGEASSLTSVHNTASDHQLQALTTALAAAKKEYDDAKVELQRRDEEITQLKSEYGKLTSSSKGGNATDYDMIKKLFDQRVEIEKEINELQVKYESENAEKERKKVLQVTLKELINETNATITEGKNLWKINKKEECKDLYVTQMKSICKRSIPEMYTKAFEEPLKTKVIPAAMLIKTSLEYAKLLTNFVSIASNDIASVDTNEMKDGDECELVNEEGGDSDAVTLLKEQLATLQTKLDEADIDGNVTSLLTTIQEANENIESMKQEIEDIKSANEPSTPSVQSPTSNKLGSSTTAISPVGKRDAEKVKTLESQIKELRVKLKKAEADAKGGAGKGPDPKEVDEKIKKAVDKAVSVAEKKLTKDIEGLEKTIEKINSTATKESERFTNQISTLESNLKTTSEECVRMTKEASKVGPLETEVSALKVVAAQVEGLKSDLDTSKTECARVTDLYQKEQQLRKKYWNEIEDIKGKIRVYARCRPFAKYEVEKGCKQVVSFPNEMSVNVETDRGSKLFSFDSCFTDKSTQSQVFSETERLMQSAMLV